MVHRGALSLARDLVCMREGLPFTPELLERSRRTSAEQAPSALRRGRVRRTRRPHRDLSPSAALVIEHPGPGRISLFTSDVI